MRRRHLVIAGVVAALAVVYLVSRDRHPVTSVTVEPVTSVATLTATVDASGSIVASRYADIGSSVMGRIVALLVREGDVVRAGQVLARIDPVQARAELGGALAAVDAVAAEARGAAQQAAAARADVATAEARLRDARSSLDRAQALAAAQLAPRADLDRAQAAFDTADASLAAARAGVQRAESARVAATQRIAQARAQAARTRDVVSKTDITAPMAGVVSRLQVREGEMVVIGVQNQPGTILMTVSDLSAMNAEIKVAEADVLRVRVGQRATVTLDAIPGRTFNGGVVEVGSSALPLTGTQSAAREFRVVVRLDAADPLLKPGLTCDAQILTESRNGVLTVPLQAVVLRGGTPTASAAPDATADKTGVFVVHNDRVVFTPVTTGILGGLRIEVSGVNAGTSVVSGPFQALRQLQDGARVRVRDDATRP